MKPKTVIIGGGPAGLTAAYHLGKAELPCVVLEKDNIVGGISRTVEYKGYRFDIGGHRFFTKVQVVEDMWHEVMDDDDFLRRNRLSSIYYNKKYFDYPLQATNALAGLGLTESALIMFSFLKAKILPIKPEETFEQWVTNRFGKRLYNTFFKTYTEKVWGIPCTEIRAEWAAQRIKGLSLITAMKDALFKSKASSKGDVIKTLISAFDYPRLGPGMMWEKVTDLVRGQGNTVEMETAVKQIHWAEGRVEAVSVTDNKGLERRIEGSEFISSMPIRTLIRQLSPAAPPKVLEAAEKLKYRDFLTVALIINKEKMFPDNWIYIHDSEVQVGRIQNFKNWSPEMVPDPSKTCLGLEYFCFAGDGLWTTSDEDLVALGAQELERLGLVSASMIEDGAVVRMPKAYPVYDATYREALDVIQEFLAGLSNLQLVGRNGMHKYNNQDHSMLSAMLAVENIMGAKHDLWAVNQDDDYHEEVREGEDSYSKQISQVASTQPKVPKQIDKKTYAEAN